MTCTKDESRKLRSETHPLPRLCENAEIPPTEVSGFFRFFLPLVRNYRNVSRMLLMRSTECVRQDLNYPPTIGGILEVLVQCVSIERI